MKRLVTTISFLLAFGSLHAQQFSLGVRSGATYIMVRQGESLMFNAPDGQTTSWEKGIFFRATGKRVSWEVTFSHYRFNANQSIFNICFPDADEPYCSAVTISTVDNAELSLVAQYALRKNNGQRFMHFAGLSVIPGRERTTTETQLFGMGTEKTETNDHNSLSFWTGVNYTASYRVTNHIFISSELSYKIDPFSFLSNFHPASFSQPNHRIGFNIGAGYVL